MSGARRSLVAGVGVALAAGAAVAQRLGGRASLASALGAGGHDDPDRWRAVTVNLPPGEVDSTVLPPLTDLGDAVEVRTRPAPGDKGTEIAARLTGRGAERLGDDPLDTLRSALRQAKQVVETGEVLQAAEPGTAERTAVNRPFEAAYRRSGGEGRL